jgi:hypothetical protein
MEEQAFRLGWKIHVQTAVGRAATLRNLRKASPSVVIAATMHESFAKECGDIHETLHGFGIESNSEFAIHRSNTALPFYYMAEFADWPHSNPNEVPCPQTR